MYMFDDITLRKKWNNFKLQAKKKKKRIYMYYFLFSETLQKLYDLKNFIRKVVCKDCDAFLHEKNPAKKH